MRRFRSKRQLHECVAQLIVCIASQNPKLEFYGRECFSCGKNLISERDSWALLW